jgi:PAS domain S-box-containing protein
MGNLIVNIACEDITERKNSEKELSEKVELLSKKNRYESIIRAVTESVHESLDLDEVFDNAVDALNKYVDGAEHVVIFMVEGNDAVLKAHRGHTEEYITRLQRIPRPKGATWKTILEGIPRYVPDTESDDALGPAGKEFGTKSYLSMPIHLYEETIGCIHIHSREIDRFNPDDLDMLLIVSRQLESAVQNAKQAQDLKESRENLQQKLLELSKKKRYEEIINTVTASIHSSIDLHQVLENAVQALNKNVDGADNVCIYFVEGNEAVLQAHCGCPDWFIENTRRIPYQKGYTWKTIKYGELFYCPDAEKDKVIGPAGKKVGTKSYASMPIKYNGSSIGCININSMRKDTFDRDELKLLEIIASQIEISVNNARKAEALKISEERYRTLFYQTPVGVYTFDKDLIITNTNDRHAEIMQSSRDDIIGLDINDLNDKSFNPLHERAVQGESGTQEGFYKSTTGSADLYILVSAAPIRDASENIIGGMAIVEDITERRQAEEALRQSQQTYETLINSVEGIVWAAELSTQKFIFVSKQAETILGYPTQDWINEKQMWFEKLHPDDKGWVLDFCATEISHQRDHMMEYRIIASDGRIVWLKESVSVVVDKGEVVELKGLMVDITDLKKAEDMLKESADRYRTLVENIYDLVAECDSNGHFVYLSSNYLETMGYDPEELIGRNIFEHVHPEDIPLVTREFSRAPGHLATQYSDTGTRTETGDGSRAQGRLLRPLPENRTA